MFRISFFSFLLSAAAAFAAEAPPVFWQTADTGDPSDIELVFENTQATGTVPPPLPALPDGASLTFVGQRSATSISMSPAGTVSRVTTSLGYRARSRNGEAFEIPEFNVQTQRGLIKVEPFKVGAVQQAAASIARSTLAPASNNFWAGEVVPLNYTLDAAYQNIVQLGATLGWTPAPFAAEEWSRPDVAEVNVNGERRNVITYKTRGYAKTPGRYTLNPVHQEISIQRGTIGVGFLQQPRLELIAVTSSRPEVTVKPLPTPAPAGFSGAVGQFKLVSTVTPESVSVGEPVTWTLTLSGQGNWPEVAGLPGRDVSSTFQVVQPQGKRTLAEGKMFDGEFAEDVVLVATKPGTYDLGPVRVPYFDPKTGKYETAVCEKITITVKGDPNSALTLSNPIAPETTDTVGAAGSGGTPPPPPPPGVIPRDPIRGTATALRPLPQRTVLIVATIPVALLLAFWGGLALARARATDPQRFRRAARQGMTEAIAELRTANAPDRRVTLLRTWQSNAGVLWGLHHAAPSASALSGLNGKGPGASTPEWSKLWSEADRAIYGPEPTLPKNWTDRADAVLNAKRIARFSPFQLFLPRNIVPLVALAAIGVAAATALDAADSPEASKRGETVQASEAPEVDYWKGKFAEAEKGWRARAAAQTNDWVSRYNLALALMQQDKGPEAAAHATAAFVQHPRNASVRWHLAPVFEKAAYTPEPLVGFINPGAGRRIAQMASPAEWQWILFIASSLACAAAGWLLRQIYRGQYSRGHRFAAGTLLSMGIVLVAVSILGQRAYGDAGKPRAVIAWRPATLRSIPTEADDAQQTTALSAGSVAVAAESFLGWQKYEFSNGQTGWARRTDFVPIW